MKLINVLSLLTVPPSIDKHLASDRNMSIIAEQPLAIDCPAKGVPRPKITWYKDGQEIFPENEPTIRILSYGRRIEISRADVQDSGRYTCVAENPAGRSEEVFNLNVWSEY